MAFLVCGEAAAVAAFIMSDHSEAWALLSKATDNAKV
jgi:hypothetical protein